ncbi:MAG TPA: hypothetical protein PKH39_16115, partial [Woeseiaceae bacterium]|nr:hypothetical protein [Woeseiaceae bacterium]
SQRNAPNHANNRSLLRLRERNHSLRKPREHNRSARREAKAADASPGKTQGVVRDADRVA